MNKLTVGLLLGLMIASVAVMTMAGGEPPTTIHDRICVCNNVGSCMWVVPGSLHTGLTEMDDSKCGAGEIDKKKPTPTWIIVTVEPPVPLPTATIPQPDVDATPDPAMFGMMLLSEYAIDVCSIDECSARETMSAGMATLAAAASKP
jgi:hypothetical protein